MAKKRVIGRYPKAFRKMAVERLKRCDNIVALSQELGVHRRLLYKWVAQIALAEPVEMGSNASFYRLGLAELPLARAEFLPPARSRSRAPLVALAT